MLESTYGTLATYCGSSKGTSSKMAAVYERFVYACLLVFVAGLAASLMGTYSQSYRHQLLQLSSLIQGYRITLPWRSVGAQSTSLSSSFLRVVEFSSSPADPGSKESGLNIILNSTALQQAFRHDWTFYLFTLSMLETQFPKLRTCGITVWAQQTYEGLLLHPRRTQDIAAASFAVLPPYLAWETNWPNYGGGLAGNGIRQGHQCGGLVSEIALNLTKGMRRTGRCPFGITTLLIHMYPWYVLHGEPNGLKPFEHDCLVWAKLNHKEDWYRKHMDISMPPPLHHEQFFRSLEWDPVTPTKYFLTFKGNYGSHPLREQLAELHDPGQGVVFVDSRLPNATKWSYKDLLTNSTFTVVNRGDVEFSYRYTEAVCSGAVPVVISDNWVMPFVSLMPLDLYGVRIAEKDLSQMVQQVRRISAARVAKMRRNARALCQQALLSVDRTVDTMLLLTASNLGKND